MPVTLRAERGPLVGRSFTFDEHDTFIFGRATDCHARIPEGDTSASRHHFVLEISPPFARVRDLGSTNGTIVGGRRLGVGETCDLREGDVIEVGETRFRVSLGSEAAVTREVKADLGAAVRSSALASYDIQKKLGEGGMGAVFLARRRREGDLVALKVLLPALATDAAKREAFLREADTMLRLQHPNLLAALGIGEAGPGFFVAMPYCEWGNVSGYMESFGGVLPWATAVPMFRQMLLGLAFAHERGFVHRDLKPDNVLVSSENNGTIKVADFGLAKSFERAGLSGMTITGATAGTPLFMPREQLINFKRVKPSSDVWSVAATVYHMLTGLYPRELKDGMDPLAYVLHSPIVPLSKRSTRFPGAACAVIDAALDPDPQRRPEDAGALLRAFEAAS